MASTLKLGNGNWGVKEDSLLAYSDKNNNFLPFPFDFSRASSATVVNKAGLIETVQSGISRIDFKDDANGALLLEPQSTNLVPYSEDFTQWSFGATYITPNYAISPNGIQNASRCLFTGANQLISITTSISVGVECAASIYIRGVQGETILMAVGGVDSIHTLNGNWQRIQATKTSINSSMLIGTFGGVTARDILIWGAQLEQQSYPTSYIPTSGASSTRLQDIATNSGNASLINSTGGVLYAEVAALDTTDNSFRFISLSDGNQNNVVKFVFYLNAVYAETVVNGVNQGQTSYTFPNISAFNKIGFKWKENDFSLWVNGVEVSIDTNGTVLAANTLTNLSFDRGDGVNPFYGKTKALAVYKTALTDAELAELTTI